MSQHETSLPLGAAASRLDTTDLQLAGAIRAAVSAGTVVTDALHDAVCRFVRAQRRYEIASADVVNAIVQRARPYLGKLPAFARKEFERQIAWWVAQEYHRDD